MFPNIWNNLPQQFQNDLATTATFGTLLIILYYIYIRNIRKNAKKRRGSVQEAKRLDGPFSWPIVGNASQISDGHITFCRWAEKYGPVYRIKLGTHFTLVLNSLSAIKQAINQHRDIYSGRPIFKSNEVVSFGRGVAFNDRTTMPDWHKRKGFMVKKLHLYVVSSETKQKLEQNATKMILYLGTTVEQQAKKSVSGYIDPADIVKTSIGNFMCLVCFGRSYPVTDEVFLRLLSNNKEFGEVAGMGNRIDTMPCLKIMPKYRKAAKEFETLSKRIRNWVYERFDENLAIHERGECKSLVDVFLQDDWTSNLINGCQNGSNHSNSRMNKIDFVALFVDIFGAGQDTLVSAQLFIFHYMLKYPSIAKKIRNEVNRVIGKNGTISIVDRPSLPYTEAVVHEVFRHSSLTATTIPHRTLADSVVQGYHVPSNSLVLLNFYAVNHDPNFWKSPEVFHPERFLLHSLEGRLELNKNIINKYLVFSSGARKCPGDEITFHWLILSTSILLHKYDLMQDPNYPATEGENFGLTARPQPFKMKLVRRHEQSNGTS
ncbi:cytochrome P450 1B1-like [Styela clava]